MFDDQPQNTGQGNVPSNLPTGEPEDIFANVDNTQDPDPAPKKASQPAQDDSTQNTDIPAPKTALSAGVLKPKENEADKPAPQDAPSVPRPQETATSQPQEQPSTQPARSSGTQGFPPLSDTPQSTPQTEKPPTAPDPAMSAPGIEKAPTEGMNTQNQSQTMHSLPTDASEMYAVKEPKASKGIITAIIVIVVVLVLGGGGLFIYNQFIANSSDSPVPTENLPGAVVDDETDENTDTANDIDFDQDTAEPAQTSDDTEDVSAEDDVRVGEPRDIDADGLDDMREDALGTDPNHWDTDGDELSDGDEVIIWKTDPLNPDTDGDGYKDGMEIKSGYSPTGPGKIFEPPQDISASSTTSS